MKTTINALSGAITYDDSWTRPESPIAAQIIDANRDGDAIDIDTATQFSGTVSPHQIQRLIDHVNNVEGR
jgi:hypothetical protein